MTVYSEVARLDPYHDLNGVHGSLTVVLTICELAFRESDR